MQSHWLKLGWAYHQSPASFEETTKSASCVSLGEGAPNVLRVTGFRLDSLETVVKLYEDISEFKTATFQAAAQNSSSGLKKSRTAIYTLPVKYCSKRYAEHSLLGI